MYTLALFECCYYYSINLQCSQYENKNKVLAKPVNFSLA